MQNKKLILLVVLFGTLALSSVLYSEEKPPFSERWKQSNPLTDKDKVRPDGVVGSAIPNQGEQLYLPLDAGISAINEQFGAQMNGLEEAILNSNNPDEQMALETQVQELKGQWWLAWANRKLEIAREKKDDALAAEILSSIEAVQNPRPAQRVNDASTDPAKISERGAK